MKIRVIKNAWYNLEYIKGNEGRIIDYKGDKIPSWGEKVKGDKKAEVKTPEANKIPESNEKAENIIINTLEPKKTEETENKQTQGLNDAEKEQYLELLINEAMDKNILIEDADKKTVDEQIAELEIKLGKGK